MKDDFARIVEYSQAYSWLTPKIRHNPGHVLKFERGSKIKLEVKDFIAYILVLPGHARFMTSVLLYNYVSVLALNNCSSVLDFDVPIGVEYLLFMTANLTRLSLKIPENT